MAVYKTKWFERWAKKNGLSDKSLCAAIAEISKGLYVADLGAGLLKKRIARPGQGKSGGFRTLIATKLDARWIFIFGFPKNERSNIDKDEEIALKALAAHLLSMTTLELNNALSAGELIGVDCHA